MRIALTITELDPGGAELCLVNLAIYLQDRGHDVKVFALGPTPARSLGASPQRNQLPDKLDAFGVPWMCGTATSAWSFPQSVRWLHRELNRFNPDLIQSMLFHANFVSALANLATRRVHYGGARVKQPQRLRRWLQRWAARHMERVVCVSGSVAEFCHASEHIPLEKLVVIPNGIEIPTETCSIPNELSKCFNVANTPFLLFVGRLSEQKGIEVLMENVDDLLGPLPNHHFVLIGDGPLRQRIDRLCEQSQYGNRIHVVGWQSNAARWMQHCQQLLLPTVYEGMPNVVLEAMAAQKPVVAFSVEGVAELLGANTASQTAPPGDFTAFANLVHRIARDTQLSEQLGKQNRERVELHFQLEKQLAKYEQLYLSHTAMA